MFFEIAYAHLIIVRCVKEFFLSILLDFSFDCDLTAGSALFNFTVWISMSKFESKAFSLWTCYCAWASLKNVLSQLIRIDGIPFLFLHQVSFILCTNEVDHILNMLHLLLSISYVVGVFIGDVDIIILFKFFDNFPPLFLINKSSFSTVRE